MKIPLSNIVFSYLQPLIVSSEENTFTLTAGLRFNDKSLSFFSIKLCFEVFGVTW